MTGNSTDLPEDIDDDGAADPQALHIEVDSPVPGKLANANDARRRLENYWEEKALEEELKNIDDWDDADSAG